MEDKKQHISSYNSLLMVLIGLFIMTGISVMVTEIHFSTFSVGVALLLASVKGYLVLTYFMHLKYDEPMFRIMVMLVFLLFAIVIGITFIDYLLR